MLSNIKNICMILLSYLTNLPFIKVIKNLYYSKSEIISTTPEHRCDCRINTGGHYYQTNSGNVKCNFCELKKKSNLKSKHANIVRRIPKQVSEVCPGSPVFLGSPHIAWGSDDIRMISARKTSSPSPSPRSSQTHSQVSENITRESDLIHGISAAP